MMPGDLDTLDAVAKELEAMHERFNDPYFAIDPARVRRIAILFYAAARIFERLADEIDGGTGDPS